MKINSELAEICEEKWHDFIKNSDCQDKVYIGRMRLDKLKKIINFLKGNNYDFYLPLIKFEGRKNRYLKTKVVLYEVAFPGYIFLAKKVAFDFKLLIPLVINDNCAKISVKSLIDYQGFFDMVVCKQNSSSKSFKIGDRVKINKGALKGFLGVLSRIKNNDIAQVAVDNSIFQTVNVPFDFLELS